jgi:hypothetical protein
MLRRSRYNHWTCSNLANLIRGTKKPYALDWKGWDDWHTEAQNKHPVRYWLAEKGLKKLQDFVMFPSDLYYTIKIYIQNRWIDQTHVLKTGLKPGEYYEFDYKVLYGLFNELSDYVEIELAAVSRCVKSKRYKFVNGRSREAGLDHLNWASSLIYNEDYGTLKGDKHYGEITPQALSAQKIKELYLWWKDIRPNRSDLDELYKSKEYKKIEKVEKKYDKEDTEKLIELIKIRREIWS